MYTDARPLIDAEQKDSPASYIECSRLMESMRPIDIKEDSASDEHPSESDIYSVYMGEIFTAMSSESGIMTVATKPGDEVVSKKKAETIERNKRAGSLMATWLAENAKLTVTAIKSALKEAGCGKGDVAIRKMMGDILGTGLLAGRGLIAPKVEPRPSHLARFTYKET